MPPAQTGDIPNLLVGKADSTTQRLEMPGAAQTPVAEGHTLRPIYPTRDARTPGFVSATELPDGANAPVHTDGNFILSPTHKPAPQMTMRDGVPQGTVIELSM